MISTGGAWVSMASGTKSVVSGLLFAPKSCTQNMRNQKFIVPMVSLKWQVAIPVSCHEAPLLATMWKNWTQQILDNLPWMTKRERKLTFCNLHQLTQVESKSQVTSKNAFDKTSRFYITQLASANMINPDIKCAGATVGTGVGATCVTCVTGARMGFRISL